MSTSSRAIVFLPSIFHRRFRARCRGADFQRRGAAKNTDRLREPKQLGDAAVYGVAKGLLQRRRLGGGDHSDEPAAWRDGGGQRRCVLCHAVHQRISRRAPGFSDEACFHSSQKRSVLRDGSSRHQRCAAVERQAHRRRYDQGHGPVGRRRNAASEGIQSKSAASGRHRRRASAHAGAHQRRGGSDLRRAAARFNAQKNGLSGVGRPARSRLALRRYAHFRSSHQGKSAGGQAHAQGAAAIAPCIFSTTAKRRFKP